MGGWPLLDLVLEIFEVELQVLVVDHDVNGLLTVRFSSQLDELVVNEFGELGAQGQLVAHVELFTALVVQFGERDV